MERVIAEDPNWKEYSRICSGQWSVEPHAVSRSGSEECQRSYTAANACPYGRCLQHCSRGSVHTSVTAVCATAVRPRPSTPCLSVTAALLLRRAHMAYAALSDWDQLPLHHSSPSYPAALSPEGRGSLTVSEA